MNVTNSIVDFFQGSPFANPIGILIEKSTDSHNEGENWTLFMEVCDLVNSHEEGPRLAIRAIKRRIVTEIFKDNASVLYSLTLLETCVKNCGYRFHLVVCTRDFLQELERIVVQNRLDVSIVVRDRIMYLIQSWHDSFKGQPDLKEIEITYFNLIEAGAKFPMVDMSTMSPINTPKKAVPVNTTAKSSTEDIAKSHPIATFPKSSNRQEPNPSQNSNTENLEKSADKLSRELNIVQCNIDVFSELMRDYPPTEIISDDAIGLMKNLNNVCLQMQTRLVELINKWEEIGYKDSSILFELLRVNDELNSILAQYERYDRTVTSMANKGDNTDLKARISKSNLQDVYAAQQESEHFYDGFSKINTKVGESGKESTEFENLLPRDNLNVSSRPSNTLSSQEFDQFLADRSTHAMSLNGDQNVAARSDRIHQYDNKSGRKDNSDLFDL